MGSNQANERMNERIKNPDWWNGEHQFVRVTPLDIGGKIEALVDDDFAQNVD